MFDNGNTLQLQRFSPQDAATVITWCRSITEGRWWAGPQTTLPVPSDVFQRWHDDPDVRPYVLTDGTTLLGYGELWVDAEEQEVELARLIIAPEQRGQGLGVAFVRRLLAEAWQTGYPRTFLRVFPDNHVAISCYRRAGFADVSADEQHGFNQGQPIDYLWMSCFPE